MEKKFSKQKATGIVMTLIERGEWIKLTLLTLSGLVLNILGIIAIPGILYLVLSSLNIFFSPLPVMTGITICIFYILTAMLCAKYIDYIDKYVQWVKNN